jgi:threonine dehydrogenase-like Zn-dependent dehydrogenase
LRALIYDGTARVVADAPTPTPAPGELLLKVLRAGVCATDLEILRGYMNYRGILGHEFVGVVTGGDSAWIGRRVAAEINCVCGRCDLCMGGLSSHCRRRTVIGIDGRPGAFAEYVAAPQRNCHAVPESVSDDEAVFVEPLAAAFQVLRQVPVEPRHQATVLGSGRLGLLVAQVLARTQCRLTVVGRNPRTLGWLDRRGIRNATVGELRSRFDQDLVVDCTGAPEGLELAMQLVRPRGVIVMKSTHHAPTPVNLAPLVVHEVTLLGSRCGPFGDALAALARQEVEVQSLVTRSVPLSRGLEALEAAASADQIKVLIRTQE